MIDFLCHNWIALVQSLLLGIQIYFLLKSKYFLLKSKKHYKESIKMLEEASVVLAEELKLKKKACEEFGVIAH